MATTNVIVIGSGPIKSDAALHGKDIGYVYVNNPPVELGVDMALEHENWVPITNPNPWVGANNPEHLQGWIKKSRIAVDNPDVFKYMVEIDKSTGAITWKLIE